MAPFDMKELARRGAELRVAELTRELEAIYGAFPDLRQSRRGAGVGNGESSRRPRGQSGRQMTAQEPPVANTPRKGKRRKMTAAERKAVSQRMKKYWAERMQGKK